MLETTKKYFIHLLYENGEASLTRFLVFLSFLLFAGGSIYLMLKNQTWGHYSEFATLTGGGGIAGQIANKLINSSKCSEDNQPYIKNPLGNQNSEDSK